MTEFSPAERHAGSRRRRPVVDLALDPPRAARADPRAPHDDRVRQQPPDRRAARREPERARRARSSCAPTTARSRASSGSRSRTRSRADGCARSSPRRRSSSASTWARSTSSSRSSRPLGRERAAADRPRRPPGRRAERRQALPEVPRRPAADGRRRRADARRRHRGDALPAEPARRARAADRRDVRGRRVAGRRSPRGGAPRRQLRRALRRRVRRGARPARRAATRPTRSPSCGRASCGTGRTASSARGRAPRGSPSRPAARSPTAACSACSRPTGRASASSTRRWCTSARAARCSCSARSAWRIEDITLDRVVVTPAPGEPGKMPFWKAPGPGRPLELGRAIGGFTRELRSTHADEALASLRDDLGLDERAANNLVKYLDEQASDGRRPRRPHDRRRALPRRDRRLAGLHPVAVRRARARAVGARDRGAADRPVRSRRAGAVERRRHRAAPARGGRRDPARDAAVRPRRDRGRRRSRRCPGTALFASVFREAAARALLLPRRRPGARTPLWQQRQRAPTC